jgi:hypothetical protein
VAVTKHAAFCSHHKGHAGEAARIFVDTARRIVYGKEETTAGRSNSRRTSSKRGSLRKASTTTTDVGGTSAPRAAPVPSVNQSGGSSNAQGHDTTPRNATTVPRPRYLPGCFGKKFSIQVLNPSAEKMDAISAPELGTDQDGGLGTDRSCAEGDTPRLTELQKATPRLLKLIPVSSQRLNRL